MTAQPNHKTEGWKYSLGFNAIWTILGYITHIDTCPPKNFNGIQVSCHRNL